MKISDVALRLEVHFSLQQVPTQLTLVMSNTVASG